MNLFKNILATFFLFVAGAASLSASTENVSVRFRFGKAEADLGKLEQILSSADASKIVRIEVRASSSPDGPYAVNKELARSRAAFVSGRIKELCPGVSESSISTTVVAEDWSGVEWWLKRCGKSYKDEALKIVTESPASEKEAKLQDLWAGEAWDDLMRSAFPGLRRVKVTIVFSEVENVEKEESPAISELPDSGSVRILFPAGLRYVRPEHANNAAVLPNLASLAAGDKSLRIVSYASPEGAPVNNELLAKYRAECVRKYLVDNYAVPVGKIVIENMGEDWDGLLREVRANYDGSNKDVVVGILSDASLSGPAKKAAIRGLDGNATWAELIRSCMPDLRAVVVSAQ